MNIVLASASQRRQDLLTQFGYEFSVVPSDAVEIATGAPIEIAEGNAYRKVKALEDRFPRELIIGADTIVVCEEKVLGKPGNYEEAKEILHMLSGQEHMVITGVALLCQGSHSIFHERTIVQFRQVADYEIEGYIGTNESFDKAGAYGIQGIGGAFVQSIFGCYYNVVGLPMPRLIVALRSYGWDIFAQGRY